jgi:hypothetical protein
LTFSQTAGTFGASPSFDKTRSKREVAGQPDLKFQGSSFPRGEFTIAVSDDTTEIQRIRRRVEFRRLI